MVLEAHGGGWHAAFRHAVDWISTAASTNGHEVYSIISLRIAQRISCSLQRENARAILRREVGDVCVDSALPGVVADQLDSQSYVFQ